MNEIVKIETIEDIDKNNDSIQKVQFDINSNVI
jgi:hypothetical protein